MKPKMIEAGQPIKVGELSLTVLQELEAGRDKRLYKVKDQRGALYIYKHCKRRSVKKEVQRAEVLTRIGLAHSKIVANGSDPDSRRTGYILREWIEGTRGDDWLKSWESFGAPLQIDAIEDLVSLLDKAARAGMYVGHLDPDDLVFDGTRWHIIDCGTIDKRPAKDAAARYFWKVFERWGKKLDRKRNALTHLFNALAPLGSHYSDTASGGPSDAEAVTEPAPDPVSGGASADDPASGGASDDSSGDVDDDSSGELPVDTDYNVFESVTGREELLPSLEAVLEPLPAGLIIDVRREEVVKPNDLISPEESPANEREGKSNDQ